MFLPFVDQSKVDNSMELFLDKIEESISYDKWYCGHYHTEKEIDKIFEEVKPESKKDMGKVMKEANIRLKGKADFKLVSEIVNSKLGA